MFEPRMEFPEVRLVTPVTPLFIVVHVKVVPDKNRS